MELNFNVFLPTLQRISFPTTTQTEVSRILIILQHEMTIRFFSPFTNQKYEYNTSPNEKNRLNNENNNNEKDKIIFSNQNDFDAALIIAPFKTIWQIFFEAYRIQPSQARLMISRAVGIFLTRIMPFYPDQIAQSFIQTIRCLSYNSVQSPIVIASFTFIAHELSPPLLSDFLSNCSNLLIQAHPTGSRSLPSISTISSPFSIFKSKESSPPPKSTIFDHFSISSNDISEHIAPIISKLGFVGHDWLHQLLIHFLNSVPPQPGRHTIHAICATINHYPKKFLRESIEILQKKNICDYISIFAFFFYTYSPQTKARWKIKEISPSEKIEGCFLYDDIDITCFIDISFDILKEKNVQLIDVSLQILSILSDLDVHVNAIGEKNSEDESLDESNQDQIVTFNYHSRYQNIQVPASLLINRSSFYRLSLPLNLLKPSKKENILISSSKFHTLAYYAKEMSILLQSKGKIELNDYLSKINLDEIIAFFHEVFSGEYNEFVSSAYQAIASCFKDGSISLFNDNQDGNVHTIFHMSMDIKLIRHILFCPMISWFHCIDVLKFIQALSLNNIDSSLALDIVDILIEFSLHKNSKLSSLASATILNFVTPDNFVEILEKLINKISFFDFFEMEKLIPPITCIVKRFGGFPTKLKHFLLCVIEIVPYINDKYAVVSRIFDLLTASRIENVELLSKSIYQAFVYIVSLYEIATCKNWISKAINFADCLSIKKALWSEIDLKNIDIITDPTDNIKNVFDLMRSSLHFVFTYEPFHNLDFCLDICERCFELFPLEVSEFIYKVTENFPEKPLKLSHFYKNLSFINDYKIFQIWCRIVIRRMSTTDDDEDSDIMTTSQPEGKNESSDHFTTPTKHFKKSRSLFIVKDENFVDTSSSGSGIIKVHPVNEAIAFLNTICFHFFSTINSSYENLELIATFATFPIATFSQEKRQIIEFLNCLPEDRLKTVLFYAKTVEYKGECLLNEFNGKFDEDQLNNTEYISKRFSYPTFLNFKFELNKNLDPDTLLMMAIHSGSETHVKEVLDYLQANDLKIKIPESKIPSKLSNLISKWMAKNQHKLKSNLMQSSQSIKIGNSSTFLNPTQDVSGQSSPTFKLNNFKAINDHSTFDTLIDALKFVSTEWKLVAISTIKNNNPNNLLLQLCSCEKVPKYLLINLCKIVESVKFDKNKLFNVCNMLLYEAKTTKRQRITMRLFTTSMMYAEMIPPQIVNSFVSELGDLISTLPFYELTLCIKTIGKVISNPIEVSFGGDSKAKEEPSKRKVFMPDISQQQQLRFRRKSLVVKSSSSTSTSSSNLPINLSSSTCTNNEEEDFSSNISLKKAKSAFLQRGNGSGEIGKIKSDFDSSDYELFNINKCIYNLQDTSDLDDFLESSNEKLDLDDSSASDQPLSPSTSFMKFAEKVRKKLSPSNYLYGNVQLLFFKFTKPETLLIYQMEEEDNLSRYLDTSIPSKLLIGMRQFSMRLKTLNNIDYDRFVKNIGRTILGKVFDFIELPFFTPLLMDGIIKPLLGNPNWYHISDSICKTLGKVSFSVPHYMAIYPSLLKWLPLGIRTTGALEFYTVSASLFQEVSNPKAFSLAIQCLIEKLIVQATPNPNDANQVNAENSRFLEDSKNELLLDSILGFLEIIEKNDCMYLTEFMMDLAKVIARFSFNASFITMIFTQFYKKSPRFFPAFAAFAQFIRDSPKSEVIKMILDSAVQLTDSDLKKRALRLLVDKEKIKEALVLAQNADKADNDNDK